MSTTIENTQAQAQVNFDRTMSGLKDGVASATAGVEQAQAQVRDGLQKVMKGAEDMFSFSQGNADAFARCSQILFAGLQDLSQATASLARASMEETVSTFKAISSAKSIKEAMDLQSSLVRSQLEKAVAHTSHVTDSTIKLTEQAFAPIGARFQQAAEKFGRVG